MNANDKYITVPQAAAMLGISATGMRRLLDEGVIPSIVPLTVHRRVKVSDVRAYQESCTGGGAVTVAQLPEDPW